MSKYVTVTTISQERAEILPWPDNSLVDKGLWTFVEFTDIKDENGKPYRCYVQNYKLGHPEITNFSHAKVIEMR